MSIKIIVAGPRGKMGSEALNLIKNENDFELVACIDRKNNEIEVKLPSNGDIPIYDDAEECFKEVSADIFLDLTIPEVGYKHTKLAIQHQLRPVVGTSGFTSEQIKELTDLTLNNHVGCIIAPNFAIGAILMMQFAQKAAKYFSDVEIIEKHHDQKLDAPSGTAIKTADLIKETRKSKKQGHQEEHETIEGSRGGNIDGMKIHSVRLPGLVAHQEVIFGGPGQTLSLQHDSLNRESFMDGIKFSIHQVMNLDHLVYGLENLIDE